jgi:exonuclease SbcC
MYLKSVALQGFQSHIDSLLEFVRGVNIITGSSNSGKTAILRDLTWIFEDRPLGNSFINNSSTQASTTLIVIDDDGMYHKIVKVKDRKKTNTYFVWKNIYGRDLTGVKPDMEFNAFKGEVPLEIRRLLNMGEVNIQGQLSPYFLVLDSPGQVAQHIRTVAGLEDIDKVIGEIESRIRSTTKDVATYEEDLKAKEKELGSYERLGLEDLESYIESCKQVESVADSLKLQISLLKGFIREYKESELLLKNFEQIDLNLLENYIQYTKDALQESYDLDLYLIGLETTIKEIRASSRFDKVGEFEDLLTEAPLLAVERDRLRDENYLLNNTLNEIEASGRVNQLGDFDDLLLDATVLLETDSILLRDVRILLEGVEDLESSIKEAKGFDSRIVDCVEVENTLLDQLDDCPYCGQALTIRAKETLLGKAE